MEKSRRKPLTEVILEYAEITSAHGIRQILEQDIKIITRVLWLLVYLTMVAAFITSFGMSLKSYLKFESQISMTEEKNDSFNFPAITICNINFAVDYKANESYPGMSKILTLTATGLQSLGVLQEFASNLSEEVKSASFREYYDTVKYELNEMFVECQAKGEIVNCSDYITELHTDKGACYTFNSMKAGKEVLTIENADVRGGGVSLLIDVHPETYIFPAMQATGLYLLIHDQEVYPLLDHKSFIIAPGQQAFIPIQKVVSTALPYPYSSETCLEPNESLDSSSHTGYPYSEEVCLYHCIFDTFEQATGGCSLFEVGHDNPCNLLSALSIFKSAYTDYMNGKIECGCLPTCQKTEFEYQVTSSTFAHKAAEDMARYRNWTATSLDEIRSRYLQINVYYETMKYLKVQQIPSMDIGQLFTNLGGNLGLFLGSSLTTLIEFIELVVVLLYRCAKNQARVEVIHVKPDQSL